MSGEGESGLTSCVRRVVEREQYIKCNIVNNIIVIILPYRALNYNTVGRLITARDGSPQWRSIINLVTGKTYSEPSLSNIIVTIALTTRRDRCEFACPWRPPTPPRPSRRVDPMNRLCAVCRISPFGCVLLSSLRVTHSRRSEVRTRNNRPFFFFNN